MSFKFTRFPQIEELLPLYQSYFLEEGFSLEILCICDTHILVILYNAQYLEQRLRQSNYRAFLSHCGYNPANLATVSSTLQKLKERFSSHANTCPHEVGVFLGYPLEDIEGFIKHAGENAKFCGFWKVYGDEVAAREKFSLYEKATKLYCEMLRSDPDIFSVCSKIRRNKTWQTSQ